MLTVSIGSGDPETEAPILTVELGAIFVQSSNHAHGPTVHPDPIVTPVPIWVECPIRHLSPMVDP